MAKVSKQVKKARSGLIPHDPLDDLNDADLAEHYARAEASSLDAIPCGCRCSVHCDTVIPTGWLSDHHHMIATTHCVRIVCARCKVLAFVRQVARLTKDGECASCGKDGFERNRKCRGHRPFDMPNDDAVETLHSLISQARAIIEGARSGK